MTIHPDTPCNNRHSVYLRIDVVCVAAHIVLGDVKEPVVQGEKAEMSCRLVNVLEELRTIPNAEDMDEHAIQHAIAYGHNGDSEDPRFPPGWCDAFKDPRLQKLSAFLRAFVLLRWPCDMEIIDIFRRMADSMPIHEVYIRAFYHLCALLQPNGRVSDEMRRKTQSELVSLVVAHGKPTLKLYLPMTMHRFSNGQIWSGFVAQANITFVRMLACLQ